MQQNAEQALTFAALIMAAGRGERAGAGDTPKQLRLLRGRPVLAWSLAAIAEAGAAEIVIVTAPDLERACAEALADWPVRIVHGGATRTASVRAGLGATGDVDCVLIHDAARPGLSGDVIARLLAAIGAGAHAAAPALPAADALYRASADGRIASEIERGGAMRVQTPQAFRAASLRAAYAAAPVDASFSDDLAIVRAAGMDAILIPGDHRLMKLTYPEDFAMLDRLLGGAVCVGSGFDAHRFGPGEHVTLCGVRIAHDKGLTGHSDADAAWHALVDAILGALGEGDIGAHFPPSDPRWKGADSELFLRHARKLAEQAGARIQHVDVTLICENPKIGPHRQAMRVRTAEVLALPLTRVSIKATTTERMGFTGREEGLAAQAIATLERAPG